MAQEPSILTPDASPWHWWGAELRQFRIARSLSLAKLGDKVHVSPSYLAKIERAERSARRDFAIACDHALDLAGGLLSAWDQAAARAGQASPGRGAAGVHVSKPAAHVSNHDQGLAYRSVDQESWDDLEITVPCRLRDGRMSFVTIPRRDFLRGLGAAGAATILVSGSEATKKLRTTAMAQFEPSPIEHFRRLRMHLIASDNLLGPRRVIPTVRESIQAIQSLRTESRGLDRQQLLELQTQFAEFASWLYQDAGDHQAAQYWLDRALPWSHMVGNSDLTSYVMARKAQLAGEMQDATEIVDLAEASQKMARPGTRLIGVGQTYAGLGHALIGDASASKRAFDEARLVAEDAETEPSPWGTWLNSSYVEVHRAQGLEVLGEHTAAAAGFASAIQQLPEDYHRDRGVYMAREAVAHAGAGVPDHAAEVGLQALIVGQATGSGRILNEIARLDNALAPWADLPEVIDLRALLNETIPYEVGKETI